MVYILEVPKLSRIAPVVDRGLTYAAGWLAATAVIGCFGTYTPSPGQSGSGGTAADSDTDQDTSSSTTSVASTGSSEDESDTAAPSTVFRDPDARLANCHVNFLVVIDVSLSMGQFQGQLFGALFSLATSFEPLLDAFGSYRLGVTTNSAVPWNVNAEFGDGPALDCTGRGSLMRPQGKACFDHFGGLPYFTKGVDLMAAMTCLAAIIGEAFDVLEQTQPLEAIVDTLSPEANAPGGCNAGFYPADEPLVVIVVTDSDQDQMGSDVVLASRLLATTGGTADNMVMSVIARNPCSCGDGDPDCGSPCPEPGPDEEPPRAPCFMKRVTDLVFAAEEVEGNLSFTDICQQSDETQDPFRDAFVEAFWRGGARVCAAD